MSAEKNLPIDSDNLIEDDSPIISVNTAKIKKFFVKALPYAVAGLVTAAAGAVAVALSSDSDDDVDPIVIDKNSITDDGVIETLEDGTVLLTKIIEKPNTEITED